MTKREFEFLSRDQQYAEIADKLGGGLMTAQEKRYFESKTEDQQLAEIWDAASSGGGGGGSVTAGDIAALNFSTLPTSDPGSGKFWLNGGVVQVGA